MYPKRVRKHRHAGAVLLALAILFMSLTSIGIAQSGESYDLSWWTVNGGGSTFSSGGGYSLGSTTGQPDAGILSGEDFTLAGGFWNSAALASDRLVYLPLVNMNH